MTAATSQAKMSQVRVKWLCLLGITLLAAFLRLYRLDQIPPGDGYDQAWYGIDAVTILRGEHPIFFPTNSGREALFSYLVALLYAGLHSTLAIYAATALIGILTVPAVYLAGEALFADEEEPLRTWGGLVAALAVALAYWHVMWSRYGVRAIMVPLVAALTLGLLWQGLRSGRRAAFLGCGMSLGLAMYTYQAARLLPLLVLLGFVYTRWADARAATSRRGTPPWLTSSEGLPRWRDLGLVFVVAGLIAAPLGIYEINHPGALNERVGQAFALTAPTETGSGWTALRDQVVTAALMFTVQGDLQPVHNIPGRPALDLFLAAAFVLGLLVSLWRLRRPAYLLLLSWLVLMTLPAMLAALGTAEKRGLGAVSAVGLLIAVGILVSWGVVTRWAAAQTPAWRTAAPAALALVVGLGFVYSGAMTFRDYFLVWGADPDLFARFEGEARATGRYISQLGPREAVYLSPIPPDHVSIQANSGLRPGVHGYNGRVCFLAPGRTDRPTTYLIGKDDKNSLKLLQRVFPQGMVVHEGPVYYQAPSFRAYRIPPGSQAQLAPSHTRTAEWNNDIELLGYDLDAPDYEAGDDIALTLYLEGLDEIPVNYTIFTQLLGPAKPKDHSPLWGQDDSEPCERFVPTSNWMPGEILSDTYTLPIPDDAPTADYQIIMGFYEWPSLQRLPVVNDAGQPVSDHVVLGQVHIEADE
ncbi:MAG: hypothetical protein KIT87_24945 [Anaerolineae bacterium]|nr:hypothetical protein [Anaerolineae bacterium]